MLLDYPEIPPVRSVEFLDIEDGRGIVEFAYDGGTLDEIAAARVLAERLHLTEVSRTTCAGTGGDAMSSHWHAPDGLRLIGRAKAAITKADSPHYVALALIEHFEMPLTVAADLMSFANEESLRRRRSGCR